VREDCDVHKATPRKRGHHRVCMCGVLVVSSAAVAHKSTERGGSLQGIGVGSTYTAPRVPLPTATTAGALTTTPPHTYESTVSKQCASAPFSSPQPLLVRLNAASSHGWRLASPNTTIVAVPLAELVGTLVVGSKLALA
jgi:hypothetical protein